MRIQIVSHTIKENSRKMIGRWSIIPYYLEKNGHKIDHILRNEWATFLQRYRRFKPDAIITIGPIGAKIALLKKMGMIKTPIVHDWNDNYKEVFRGWIKSRIAGLLENYVVRNSDAIITPSLYRLEEAKKLGKIENKNVFYLPHGVKDIFLEKAKKIKLPGKNKLKLIYIGEVSKAKRTDRLIKEMNNKQADLIILGNIDKEMKKESAENIYFIGQKKPEEVPSYLKSADFLIITEDNDSALKLMEYLTTSKPILAPRGKIEYLKSGYPHILFYKDFSEIPDLIKSRVKTAKSYKKPESWREIVEKYLGILGKVKR